MESEESCKVKNLDWSKIETTKSGRVQVSTHQRKLGQTIR